MFTLNGGHVWPLYDAALKVGMRIVDTRHEQTATWAAEAWAKLTRTAGLAVLTAGPGVTNGVSAITSAHFNGSPLVVLGGRAPQGRWGSGSLQELDHVPILKSITKMATTAYDSAKVADTVRSGLTAATTPHRGPVFMDFPMDVLFSPQDPVLPTGSQVESRVLRPVEAISPDESAVSTVAEMIASAQAPALIAGSDVYWGGAWDSLRRAVEAMEVPCFANGMGRGCLPADHHLAFSRTRGVLSREADLVVVVGTPLDFRLGFGRFGDARVVHLVDSDEVRSPMATTAASVAGDLDLILDAIAAWGGPET